MVGKRKRKGKGGYRQEMRILLVRKRHWSGSSDPGSPSLAGDITVLCSWAKHFILLTVPLSAQVPATLILGVTLLWRWEGEEIVLQKLEISNIHSVPATSFVANFSLV